MVKSLTFNVLFDVPSSVIYNALLDPMEVMKYTRAKANLKPEEGGAFELYDGRILGKFIKLEKDKRIVQEWKFNDWSITSNVDIVFKERDDGCKLEINQTNIPDKVEIPNLELGWRNQIFRPMSKICGYPIEEDD